MVRRYSVLDKKHELGEIVIAEFAYEDDAVTFIVTKTMMDYRERDDFEILTDMS